MLKTSIDGGCGLQGRGGRSVWRGRAVWPMSRDRLIAVGVGIGRHRRCGGRDWARGCGWG